MDQSTERVLNKLDQKLQISAAGSENQHLVIKLTQ